MYNQTECNSWREEPRYSCSLKISSEGCQNKLATDAFQSLLWPAILNTLGPQQPPRPYLRKGLWSLMWPTLYHSPVTQNLFDSSARGAALKRFKQQTQQDFFIIVWTTQLCLSKLSITAVWKIYVTCKPGRVLCRSNNTLTLNCVKIILT